MNKPGNGMIKSSPVRQPVLLGLFTGTAVGVGFLLLSLPNVELMTLVIALAGATMGLGSGFVVGALAATIYSLGSPLGLPHPLLLVAQALGMGLAGMVGHWGGQWVRRLPVGRPWFHAASLAAGTGLLATLGYSILTNLASSVGYDISLAVNFGLALPFFLIRAGVNIVIFGILFPSLQARLAPLRGSSLVGRSGGPLLVATACLLSLMFAGPVFAQDPSPPETVTALPDSVAMVPAGQARPDTVEVPPARPQTQDEIRSLRASEKMGWERSLWTPFAPTALNWLDWYSPWVPVNDGGLGASAVLLGEAGTNRSPVFLRDGIPVSTGHVLADDPALVPTEGLLIDDRGMGADGRGGNGGLVRLRTEDPDPGKAVSSYRGIKGKHETYFRAIHVLTPEAAWRAAFEFEESLDNEGYNYTDEPDEVFQQQLPGGFPGHGKVRQSRTRLFRRLDQDNQLVVEYTYGRKTKDSLPALGADQQEVWDDGLAASFTARTGAWNWSASLFTRNRDIEWGDRDTLSEGSERRKVETGRDGTHLDLTKGKAGEALTGLNLQFSRWQVYDTGTAADWAAAATGDGNGDGQTALAVARTGLRAGPTRLTVGLGAQWDSHADFGPELTAAWGADAADPWWRLDFYYGGRAPRSDELLTPLEYVVDTRRLAILPNPDLDREKTLRAGLLFTRRLLGIDLAVDGSVRRLTEGITWVAETPGGDSGTWTNGLEMDAARVTGSLGREGRFLGWGRVKLEGTWQSFDEKTGRATLLPPDRYLRLHLMWENHFFQEDGILQLALFSTRQGEMADPWDVTREYINPSRTVHDLLVGFRLVGVNLSVAMKNLTGQRTRMTAGALSEGQALDLRLYWKFHY
jgi:hypothetical protein